MVEAVRSDLTELTSVSGCNGVGTRGLLMAPAVLKKSPTGVAGEVSQFTPSPKANIPAIARATLDLRVSPNDGTVDKCRYGSLIMLQFRTPCLWRWSVPSCTIFQNPSKYGVDFL